MEQRAIITTRKGAGEQSFFGGGVVVVQDDTSQWMAWEGAQRAWLADQNTLNTARAYEVAARQFFRSWGRPPWAACTAAGL